VLDLFDKPDETSGCILAREKDKRVARGSSATWGRFGLRSRIYLLLASLVLITFLGGLIMVWYTYRMDTLLSYVIDRNLRAFQVAVALETALVNQKGFVTYYFQDGDPHWLRELEGYRRVFRDRISEARLSFETPDQEAAIDLIETEYRRYVYRQDQVIAQYKAGEREAGAALHKEIRDRFFSILERCEEYKALQKKRLSEVSKDSHDEAEKLRIIAGAAVLIVLILAFMLFFLLVKNILDPLRKLARDANREGGSVGADDEVRALSQSVHGLIEEFDHTQTELERSREHLLQSEKMALVGKLAAGVAHSIRNPLTSVKMRLFSLSRSLDLSEQQKEDFEVISEEIRHTDTIVQNFLEFSRPPKLKMQKISASEVVDVALQLMHHRLESYRVEIRLERGRRLPEIQADPEQLKEVLVNLIVNACEAMGSGGTIVIREEILDSARGEKVIIRLTDNGPGIPKSIQERIFEPFFTTKEEGTGLGLSIATRIMEEHGGRLEVETGEGAGTTFVITLPAGI
jgi:signal transduction histidine kinase